MTHDEYASHDALGLAALVRDGAVTSAELIDAAVARLDTVNPALNAVVHRMEEEARAAPATDGPFEGVPFLAKDLMSDYAGHPTSAGNRVLKDVVRDHDTELAARVRRAGLRVLGKTNTPEFGLVPFTEPEVWGPTRNPWDLERSPAGSSGGSAAAVAAGVVPMAGGGDGGGSIRMPSSVCGLFGLKPSRGRTPTGPDLGQAWRGAAVEHVLTRSVRDSAAMLDATHGPDPGTPFVAPPPEGPFLAEVDRDPGRLRIAWSTHPTLGSTVHPDCVAAVEDAVALLTELGHELVEDAPALDKETFNRAFVTMVASEVGAEVADTGRLAGRRVGRRDFEVATWGLALLGRALSAGEVGVASRALDRAARTSGQFMERYDLFLTPTLAQPPLLIGALQPTPVEKALLSFLGALGSGRLVRALGLLDQVAEQVFDFMPWTPIANVSGEPAMSVPLYWSSEGLPIGVHITARYGDEATLFRLAGQLEGARPWFQRLPEIPGVDVPAGGSS